MDLQLLIVNFQGLLSIEGCLKIRHFIKNLTPAIDILVGQEHKMQASKVKALKSVWPTVDLITAPTQDGICASHNPLVPTSCGGILWQLALD